MNRIFKIIESRTEDDNWDELSFELLNNCAESSDSKPTVTFDKKISSRFLLGEYQYGNLKIELAIMKLYDETKDSLALCFTIGDQRIDSHGVLLSNSETGLPTDRQGNAISLSVALEPDFFEWLKKLEKTMEWK